MTAYTPDHSLKLASYESKTLVWVNNHRALRGLDSLESLRPGYVMDPHSCPVARSLERASVAPHVWSYLHETSTRGLPSYVAGFIRNFDADQYPNLILTD